jgi:hypothetical protein
MRSKSSMARGTPASWAMASRWSTALVEPPLAATEAMAFSSASRVRIWRAVTAALEEIDDEPPGGAGDLVLLVADGGHAAAAHGGDAEELGGGSHGVGGELAAAGAGAGTGGVLQRLEGLFAHAPGFVGADGFEDVLDGDVAIFKPAGGDGAAVEHEAGDVEAGEGHDGAGNGLVAAGEGDDGVEGVAAGDELDGVGDDFAADEGGLHAFGAHGDAVGDGDGVELHGRGAGLADAFLDAGGEAAQVEVAGADLDPGVGDADERLAQVLVGEAHRFQHRPRRCAVITPDQPVRTHALFLRDKQKGLSCADSPSMLLLMFLIRGLLVLVSVGFLVLLFMGFDVVLVFNRRQRREQRLGSDGHRIGDTGEREGDDDQDHHKAPDKRPGLGQRRAGHGHGQGHDANRLAGLGDHAG